MVFAKNFAGMLSKPALSLKQIRVYWRGLTVRIILNDRIREKTLLVGLVLEFGGDFILHYGLIQQVQEMFFATVLPARYRSFVTSSKIDFC